MIDGDKENTMLLHKEILSDILLEFTDNNIPVSMDVILSRRYGPLLSIRINHEYYSVWNKPPFNLFDYLNSLNNMIDFLESEGYSTHLKDSYDDNIIYKISEKSVCKQTFQSIDNFKSIINSYRNFEVKGLKITVK
jgi:hypothetical protein